MQSVELLRHLMGRCGLPRGTAFQIVTHFCGITAAQALADTEVQNESAVLDAAARLESGEPLQYILGEWDFCGKKIYCSHGVLIPREDTETLVAKAESLAPNAKEALDLCCGSGCVAVALALHLSARVTAVDIDEKAVELTRRNAKLWGVEDRVSVEQKDILKEETQGRFDLVVSNPPYIKTAELALLDKSVKNFEPRLALDGGEDGLTFYRRLAKIAQKNLKPGGAFACEIGFDQKNDVCKIFEESGFHPTCTVDFNGQDRVISFLNEKK